MPILQVHQRKFQKAKEDSKNVIQGSFAITTTRCFKVIDSQPHMEDHIFSGINECFELIDQGYIRTGVFVLGRTIEEVITLYIEQSLAKRKQIGIQKRVFDKYKNYFSLYKKIEFLAGEQITLNGHKLKQVSVKFSKEPLLRQAKKSSLHEIREFGRNPGAHSISKTDFDIAIKKLPSWLDTGMDFIIDTQFLVTQL